MCEALDNSFKENSGQNTNSPSPLIFTSNAKLHKYIFESAFTNAFIYSVRDPETKILSAMFLISLPFCEFVLYAKSGTVCPRNRSRYVGTKKVRFLPHRQSLKSVFKRPQKSF
jgi:hypothetical protein